MVFKDPRKEQDRRRRKKDGISRMDRFKIIRCFKHMRPVKSTDTCPDFDLPDGIKKHNAELAKSDNPMIRSFAGMGSRECKTCKYTKREE